MLPNGALVHEIEAFGLGAARSPSTGGGGGADRGTSKFAHRRYQLQL
jgi:hypothetical protein